jgi:site-specific DNA-methyltransferase (adenine-specific)
MSDVVTIGRATLYHGDCLEILPTLPKVDAVITDPPYAVPTIVAQSREVTRNAGDLSIAETAYRVHADAWSRVLTPAGRVFVCCDGASYPSLYRAMFSQFNLALLVWDKGRIGMGREFRKSHELVLHGWRAETPIFSDGVGRADIIKAAPVSNDTRIHPAEKPMPLLQEFMRVSGETILDPFMGSGSTGAAAISTGRRFIGVEIERKYFDIACERIQRQQAASATI